MTDRITAVADSTVKVSLADPSELLQEGARRAEQAALNDKVFFVADTKPDTKPDEKAVKAMADHIMKDGKFTADDCKAIEDACARGGVDGIFETIKAVNKKLEDAGSKAKLAPGIAEIKGGKKLPAIIALDKDKKPSDVMLLMFMKKDD